ncbi:MAG: lytic transglycosylase domain-containing protein [Candidatus Acidiferrales bacterium]
MRKNCIIVAILAAGILLSLPTTSRAQIASTVDEHGKLVFVNRDSPEPRHGSTMKPASDASSDPLGAPVGKLAPPTDRLDRIVRDAAERHKVDPALVQAVISTESGWNPRAVSSKGAVGLMQLIPATARRFGGGNLFDPAQNVEAGTTYLRSLLDRYDGDLTKSLAAYNAGEHAVDNSGGMPPYWETQKYVRKVTDAYFRPGSGRDPTLWSAPKHPVRKEVASNGRVVFTNE